MKRLFYTSSFLLLSSSAFSQAAGGGGDPSTFYILIFIYIVFLVISYFKRINRKEESVLIKDNVGLSIVISIIIYFLLAWVIKDIIFSFQEYNSTQGQYAIEFLSALFASIISGAIGLLIRGIKISDILSTLLPSTSLILVITTVIASNIPISIGAVILVNAINIGYVIFNIKNP